MRRRIKIRTKKRLKKRMIPKRERIPKPKEIRTGKSLMQRKKKPKKPVMMKRLQRKIIPSRGESAYALRSL